MAASSPVTSISSNSVSRFTFSERLRDNLTGYTFIIPALVIIGLFGLFPIVYAGYMSLFEWRILPRYTNCLPNMAAEYAALPRNNTVRNQWMAEHQLAELDFGTQIAPNLNPAMCLDNYTQTIGDWWGVLLFSNGFMVLLGAWVLWGRAFAADEQPEEKTEAHTRRDALFRLAGRAAFVLLEVILVLPFLSTSDNRFVIYAAYNIALVLIWNIITSVPRKIELNPFIKLGIAIIVLAVGLAMITYGWNMMFAAGNKDFLNGLIYTVYYAIAAVPIQLVLGLVLAYVLFQNIRGKTLFRMIYFLPYITPAVAAATVFRIIFSPRPSSLANQAVALIGLPTQKWIAEAKPFGNALFGWDLHGFVAGPSMALVSIVMMGIWTYVGYNTVIYLAGLGQIPGDLYEAARVDGATEWHIFRYITMPLLSPVTFYLSILGFIGTFKSFNHIYVMRVPEAQGTTDTVSIVVFDTFKSSQEYGLATAQAILLLLIILAITQFQRSFLEKRVFYG